MYTYVNDTKIKSINWYKDGSLVDLTKLNAEYTLRGRYLYFRNVSNVVHSGSYRCDIELVTGQLIQSPNPISLSISCEWSISSAWKFFHWPKIFSYKDDYTIRIDALMILRVNKMDNVSVACIVDGYPLPRVSWKYNLLNVQYVEIKNFTEIGFPTNRTLLLMLYNIDVQNNGTYLCSSDDGKRFDRLEIIVQCELVNKLYSARISFKIGIFSSQAIATDHLEFLQ